jgi:polyisoprenyl-teichoic acid--peptidoglycan teichoic acid transferase
MRLTRKRRWMAGIAAVVIVLGAIGYMNRTAVALWGFDMLFKDQVENKLERSYQPLKRRETPENGPNAEPVSHEAKQKPFTMLLLGVDARGKEQGRSDTMILSVVRPADSAILMVSIPRDTYVEIEGHGGDKITHAYAYGKADLAVDTVERLFEVPIDHYAVINFLGFKDVIDAMGGIALPIEKDLVNDDPDHEKFIVKAGQPLYNGNDALNYVRFREDAGGDSSRTGRHQVFINAILDKASGVGQWTKIPDLIDIMGNNFTTDIRPSAIIELAKNMLTGDTRTIHSHTLKGEGKRKTRGGAWYYHADEQDLEQSKAMINDWLIAGKELSELQLPDEAAAKKQQKGTASAASMTK